MKASREMTLRPVWLFDSPLLRQALAAVNLPAVPAIVRAACGLPQRDLAVIVGWSPAALSYYERGARDGLFDIRAALQFADAVGMPRAALLPLVYADPQAGQDPADTGPDHDLGGHHAAGPASVVRAVSASHLRYWRACTDVLYERGHTTGGALLLTAARQQWQHVRPVARETSTDGSQLPAVAAELALCTAQIAIDAGHSQLARHLHAQARALAERAADTMLTAHTLADESLLAAEQAHSGPSRQPARQAMRLALQAQEESRYLPVPGLHALLALRHAAAAALLGDHAAFAGAIRQARRELDRGQPGEDPPPPAWLRHVDDIAVTAAEADGYLTLGDPGRSAQLYQQLLTGDLTPRSRATCTAGLASALLSQGAPGDAITTATQALGSIENGTAPARSHSQLRAIRYAAATLPAARDFRRRYDTIHYAPATDHIKHWLGHRSAPALGTAFHISHPDQSRRSRS